MKKIFACFILFVSINYICPECYAGTDGDKVKRDDCLKRNVGYTESSRAGGSPDTCCYEEYSYKEDDNKVEYFACGAFEKSKVIDYAKKIKEQQKEVEKDNNNEKKIKDSKYSIDCSSIYLKISIIALFIVLF
jgi:hypothetical protein